MTQIRVRIKRDGCEKNYHRLPKFVSNLHSHIQSRIVHCPLSALHPIEYALSFWIRRSGFPHRDAGIETECLDFHLSEVGENTDTFSPSSIFLSERGPEPIRIPSDAEWP